MADADTTTLVVRMHDPGSRAMVAPLLAAHLGAESIVMLVRDHELGVLVPAPGFAPTLRGGGAWRSFLLRCDQCGRHDGEVDLPADALRRALAVAAETLVVVLIGGAPVPARVDALERLMPLLAAVLMGEYRVAAAAAEVSEAQGVAQQAATLARALDVARAESVRLNERLREEHRRKDDFLAMLAHELRNPLTPLVTSIELLQLGALDDRATARQLEVMTRQIGQLSRLVEDLLDVSRVSRGRSDLRREVVDLVQLARDALEAARPVLDARGHQVVFDARGSRIVVEADPVRIRQVFANLLHNAAKYTDAGGNVAMRVRQEGGEGVVEVEDDGLGIGPDMLPKVFDLFVQAPVSLQRAQGGLGIGLTLVRSLVELHGGHVTAESPGLGQGSRFTVRLPLARADAVALTVGPQAAPTADSRAERALRVLVVDDNQDAANTLTLMLEMLGHHVHVAYSGASVLHIAADLNPDLVLLDIGLPQLDGYEVARRLRRVVRRDAWFVAITGYGTEDDQRRAREAGFDEHKVKPIVLKDVQALVLHVQRRVALATTH
jgi:signal transduction histidine kinase/ActR/RegA family two-component response regulator